MQCTTTRLDDPGSDPAQSPFSCAGVTALVRIRMRETEERNAQEILPIPWISGCTTIVCLLWFQTLVRVYKRRGENNNTSHGLCGKTGQRTRPGRNHGRPRLAVSLTEHPAPQLQHGSGTILAEDRCQVCRRSQANQQCHRWHGHRF